MSRGQRQRLANDLEQVQVHSEPAWAAGPKTSAGKRSERWVVFWLILSCLLGLAFVATYLAWPDGYRRPGEDGYLLYALQTPVLGSTFGAAVLALGVGVGTHIKSRFTDEGSVQQRHGGRSAELARETAVARLDEALADTGLARRPLLKRCLLGAAGIFGLSSVLLGVGGFVRNPWKGGNDAALLMTGWRSLNGETVYLRAKTSVLGEIERVRPEDLAPGSVVTVFPFRESDRGHEQLLRAAERASDAPVLLIRLRPGTDVVKRSGQEDFNYGDYYAFSKVCTHLGCPASQFDSRKNVTICPCHQSEFLITQSAKPIFGPATRPLPQLPITIDEHGYFVARGDFPEPVGPGFWEMRSRGKVNPSP